MHPSIALAFFDESANCTIMDWWDVGRIGIVAVAAGILIFFAFRSMVWKVEPTADHLGNFVAFNSVSLGILGAAVVIMASKQWPVALLAAGACLGVGFLFGMLFGYPLSTGGNSSGANADPNAQPSAKNLLQQSVDAISKLVAGATLVKAQSIFNEFQQVAQAISQYATAGNCNSGSYVFGAGVTIYFLLLGFLSALLLSNTYHLVTPVPDSPTAQAADKKAAENPPPPPPPPAPIPPAAAPPVNPAPDPEQNGAPVQPPPDPAAPNPEPPE